MRKLFFTFSILLLAGCQLIKNQPREITTQNFSEQSERLIGYKNEELDYELIFPSLITESGSWLNSATNEGGPFFGSEIDHSIDPPFGQRALNVEISHKKTSCRNSLAEPNTLESTDNTYIVIGEPLSIPCEVDKCDDMSGYAQYKGRYVLCSEHAGKTVRIEVNQITDNPALAEEIFKTFRWTK